MYYYYFLHRKNDKGWSFEIVPNSSAGSHSIDLAADLETLSSYQQRQLLSSGKLSVKYSLGTMDMLIYHLYQY